MGCRRGNTQGYVLRDATRSILVLLGTFVSLASLGAEAVESAPPKRVLMIHSFLNSAAPFRTCSAAFETELASVVDQPIDLDEMSLNVGRYNTTDVEEALVEFMKRRRGKWQPDVVVPIGSPAAYFVSRFRDGLFSSTTPIIYTGFDQRRLPMEALTNNATFVGTMFNMPGLVEDFLHIAPGRTNITLVIGASAYEKYWKELLLPQFEIFNNRAKFTWLDDLTFDQMLARVSRMGSRSFIVFLLLMRDAGGVTHDSDEALKRLHAVANAPIVGMFAHQLGQGIVGGKLYQIEIQGSEAALIAARVLKGEAVSNFPPKVFGPLTATYDWRELKRWKISEKSLPAASKIVLRKPTTWELYKGRIVFVLSVLVGQAALISLLVFELNRRKRVEAELRQAQTSMDLAADAAHLGMLVWETSNAQIWASEKWKAIHAFEEKEIVTFDRFLSRVHSEDRKIVEHSMKGAVRKAGGFVVQHRLVLPDGQERWIALTGRVERMVSDGFFRALGVAIDVTEQVTAERTTHEMTGRLINAQEEERKRIARDLHDDMNQRLAMLSMEAETLSRMGSVPGGKPLLAEIGTQVRGLATEIHKLSYQLHPSKLEYLGLVAAARALCQEQSQLWAVPIDFVQAEVPRELNPETALAIYRILQEALQNVGRHSDATYARVELTRHNDVIRLLITDNGDGFDMEEKSHHGGMGLVGMRERVHSVHGHIVIQSSPGQGTSIEVRVPIGDKPISLKNDNS
jgi:signal transduction histidine kinase